MELVTLLPTLYLLTSSFIRACDQKTTLFSCSLVAECVGLLLSAAPVSALGQQKSSRLVEDITELSCAFNLQNTSLQQQWENSLDLSLVIFYIKSRQEGLESRQVDNTVIDRGNCAIIYILYINTINK